MLKYKNTRKWFNGRTAASQAADAGSIPVSRSKKQTRRAALLLTFRVFYFLLKCRLGFIWGLRMCVQGLNPDKKQCYFIAYGETLALQRSYLGDVAVAKQVDPNIDEIYAEAVYEGDKFDYEIKRGKIVEVHHSQKLENKSKPITAAYATVIYKDGREVSTVMTIIQIKQAWAQSTAKPFNEDGSLKKDSVHSKFPEEMAKKTVMHKACKPIIGSSSDASLFGQYARQCADDADAAEVEQEVAENANKQVIDVDYSEVPEGVDPETGEYTEPETNAPAPQKAREPF